MEGEDKGVGGFGKEFAMMQRTVISLFMIISEDKASRSQAALFRTLQDLVQSAEKLGVIGRHEEDEWCDENGGIEGGLGLVALDKGVQLVVEAPVHDFFVDGVSGFHPCLTIGAGAFVWKGRRSVSVLLDLWKKETRLKPKTHKLRFSESRMARSTATQRRIFE